MHLLGVGGLGLVAGIAGVAAASLLWLPLTRRWSARAHLCWASSVFLFVAYLVFVLEWTFASHLGALSTIGGVVLWVLEVFAALLSAAYLWEICDALGTQHWRRRVSTPPEPAGAQRAAGYGHRHAPRAGAPGLPPLRGRGDR
jgi:hypothetical protein